MAGNEPIEAVFTSIPQGPATLWQSDYRWHLGHVDRLYRIRPAIAGELPFLDAEEWEGVTGMLVMFVAGVNGPRRLRVPLCAGDDPDECARQALMADAPVNEIVEQARKEATP